MGWTERQWDAQGEGRRTYTKAFRRIEKLWGTSVQYRMYYDALGEQYNILEGTGRTSRTYQEKLGWTERQEGLGTTEAAQDLSGVLGWTGVW